MITFHFFFFLTVTESSQCTAKSPGYPSVIHPREMKIRTNLVLRPFVKNSFFLSVNVAPVDPILSVSTEDKSKEI